MKNNKMIEEQINDVAVDEQNTTNEEVNNAQPQEFPYGSFVWALDILIKAAHVGQSHGAYTLSEASYINEAIYVVNNTNFTIND